MNARHRTMTRGALLLLAALALPACGTSGSEGSSSGPETTAATVATTATTAPEPGGGAFCATAVVEYNAAIEAIASTETAPSPAEFETMIEAARRSNQQLAAQAPSEIKADVQLVVDTTAAFYQAIADIGYDASMMSSETVTKAQEAMAAPDVAAATARVKTYVKDTCGVDLTVPGSGNS